MSLARASFSLLVDLGVAGREEVTQVLVVALRSHGQLMLYHVVRVGEIMFSLATRCWRELTSMSSYCDVWARSFVVLAVERLLSEFA